MDARYTQIVLDWLTREGVDMAPGLTDDEVLTTEANFGFRFPPDLRAFLQTALPISDPFPNWRGPVAALRERLDWPAEGICFDVERNGHWQPEWGDRPERLKDALAIARSAVSAAPVLIPVYAHRYLPSEPCLPGNPVLSVYQTDIIYYGYDLASYFRNEFGITEPLSHAQGPRPIRFWDAYLAWEADPNVWTRPDMIKWRGSETALVRDLRVTSADDVVVLLQLLTGPSQWLWCQCRELPRDTEGSPRDWHLWVDAHCEWAPSTPEHASVGQTVQGSPYTEAQGQVVWVEAGEFGLQTNSVTLRIVADGDEPEVGAWVSVAGMLNGTMEPAQE